MSPPVAFPDPERVREASAQLRGVLAACRGRADRDDLARTVADLVPDAAMAGAVAALHLRGPFDPGRSRQAVAGMAEIAARTDLLCIRAALHHGAGAWRRCLADLCKTVRHHPEIWRYFEEVIPTALVLFIPPYVKILTDPRSSDAARLAALGFLRRVGVPEIADVTTSDSADVGASCRPAAPERVFRANLDMAKQISPARFYKVVYGLDLTRELLLDRDSRWRPLSRGMVVWLGNHARLSGRLTRDFRLIDLVTSGRVPAAARSELILVDYTWEALVPERGDRPFAFLEEFTKDLDGAGMDPARVVLFHSNEGLHRSTGDQMTVNGLRVIGNTFTLPISSSMFRLERLRLGGDAARLQRAEAKLAVPDPDRRHFLCFNHMPRPHRMVVVCHLLESRAFTKSLVSFSQLHYFSHQDRVALAPSVDNQISEEALAAVQRNLSKNRLATTLLKTPEATLLELSRRLPLQVDLAFKDHVGTAKALSYGVENQSPYLDSYVSIVNETFFSDGSVLFVTEKTMKAIYGLHPFLVVGDPFILRRLRELGFETFAPYIDEAYDDIADPIERMRRVLAQIDRLAALSTDEMHGLAVTLWPRVLHNYHLLMDRGPQWLKEFLSPAME